RPDAAIDAVPLELLGGPEAPLPRDDRVGVLAALEHRDWANQPALVHALLEVLDGLRVEVFSGLVGVGANLIHRQRSHRDRLGGHGVLLFSSYGARGVY